MDLIDFVPDTEIRNWVGPFQDKKLYLESGRFETERFISLGGIGESDTVLDLGCGCGRMSIHLAGYLKSGRYVGVDASPPLLDWCREKIEPAFGNASFFFIDAYNASCHPEGKIRPVDLHLDFPDGVFDIVLAQSLFTHMRLEEIHHYLCEARRVLKPEGVLIASYYLLNPTAQTAIDKGAAILPFLQPAGGRSMTIDPEIPEEALAHEESEIERLHEETGFRKSAIRHGTWIGREASPLNGQQDVIVAIKL